MKTNLLTEAEFDATYGTSMQRVPDGAPPPLDFWSNRRPAPFFPPGQPPMVSLVGRSRNLAVHLRNARCTNVAFT